MLRISPIDRGELISQATDFRVEPGGSESNVAIALSNLGMKSEFITALPESSLLSEKIIQHLKKFGVYTNNICFNTNRLGVYWTENGIGPRNSFVIYDRLDSAFSRVQSSSINWNQINNENDWFHFSGITPALSKNAFDLILEGVKSINIPYSVDLNFRKNLWKWVDGKEYHISNIMGQLCSNAELIVANESDFQNIFEIDMSDNLEITNYDEIANYAFSTFKNLKYIAISLRDSISATRNQWSGVLYTKSKSVSSFCGKKFDLDNIVDRVGTGDSFCAGIIYGLLQSYSYQNIIDFAVTLSALNHTTRGDTSRFSQDDVLQAMRSGGSGRIIR